MFLFGISGLLGWLCLMLLLQVTLPFWLFVAIVFVPPAVALALAGQADEPRAPDAKSRSNLRVFGAFTVGLVLLSVVLGITGNPGASAFAVVALFIGAIWVANARSTRRPR